MKKILPPLLLISCLLLAFSYSDPYSLKNSIIHKLTDYSTIKYPEKIYIQTDKPYYTAGENIWFSAYLLNGVTHTTSLKSSVIYVELINERDSIIKEQKIFTESVSAKGDFALPMDLPDGNYLLRAYTNYMRNQSREFFFKKEIPILSLYAGDKKEDAENDSIEDEFPDLGFYPEGGYLVTGLNNRVAVKIQNADLRTNPIVGTIEDTQGNRITEFNTMEFGLGSFQLTPEQGKEYQAVVSSGDESVVYPLPIPLETGYVMNTSVSETDVSINVRTNKKEGLKNVLILGHQRGLTVFDFIQEKSTNSMSLKIPKRELIDGVLNIVLFDNSEKPVAERLVYIHKKEAISPSVKLFPSTVGTRERVNVGVEVKDKWGTVVPSTVSISVTDATLVKHNQNAGNIKTWLLLNSDLRGTIKSPNYFFLPEEVSKKNQLLDLTMMTHGWRRFIWQEFLEEGTIQNFEAEDGIYFNGNTRNLKAPYNNKTSETKLTFRTDGFYQESQPTDKNGCFSYGPFVFNDTIDVFIQAGDNISSQNPDFNNTNIILTPSIERPGIIRDRIITPFKQQITYAESYRHKSRTNVISNYKFDEKGEMLDEVLLSAKVKTEEEKVEMERNKRTRSFQPSHRIIVGEFGNHGASDFMGLISNVPGIRIGKKGNAETSQDFEINLRGMKPAFFLDNIKVTLEIARTVSQADIDFIDIRNTGHASAGYALEAQGVIAIYTKKGSRRGGNSIKNSKAGSINFKSNGFYSAREFFSPDYASEQKGPIRQDQRITLYWNPKIIVNKHRNASASFFTSDEKGSYFVEMEGITETGVPIYQTTFLEVE
ncbi:alpha-2-macroglobulin family protein [Aequorivita viscosa]|uniref:hypothetical protein n=1 Tax=Aequorivita viscosa TaxID=797419 RepID=UPI000932A107|nr:hypothetical protein [Aequorivita viscosa]